jgi:SpoVK/Ycf46/Vps4 family AAA+-type ATPase
MTGKKDMPILLFNEADGIIGTRMESLGSSVDKMENTMQNILLQELEDFNGILIATTNLEGTLDIAFERRFLYKLKFPKPSPEIRAKIWLSKIDKLQGEDAYTLAKEFDLSGGQIDNVARKLLVNQILHGKDEETPDIELLRRFCKEERLGKTEKIGFTK